MAAASARAAGSKAAANKAAANKAASTEATVASAGKVRALSSSPNMVGLFVRAALGARGPHGKTTPTTTFTLNDQKIDIAHLAKFQKVCGFRASDVLPSTYLHILAFPLHMALMVEPEFPFPAPGSVHVNNTITQIRPVTVDEVVSIRVHAEDLRPHDAGRQIDLVSEAYVGDELVWTDRSTYLQRGKSSGGPSKPKAAPAVAETPGGVPAIIAVPDDIGRRYAAASGDPNPIHLHSITAKLFGFKTAIAHGMWVKARTLASLEGRLPDSYTVDVAFKTPVFLPAKIAIRTEHVGDSWVLDVRNPRSGKPHLAGTIR